MTVRIRIPSSEGEDAGRADARRPPPRPGGFVVVGALAVAVLVTLIASVASVDEPSSSIPAPLERTVSEPRLPETETEPDAWSVRTMPGQGAVIAMGTVGDTPVAVTTDWTRVLVWRLVDGVWEFDGSTGSDLLASVVVTDGRVLLLGDLEGRPTVWEWIDRSRRHLFQPTSGFVAGMWSAGGRLVVAVTHGGGGPADSPWNRRSDALWIETADGEFAEVTLDGIGTVLSVLGDAESVVIGGRDAQGRAALGAVDGNRVSAEVLAGAPDGSAIIDLAGDPSSPVALLAVLDGTETIDVEIRVAAAGWVPVARDPELTAIDVVGDRITGVTRDGSILAVGFEGRALPVGEVPKWVYGEVVGVGLLGDEIVVYGQREGVPAYTGPSAEATEVMLPVGRWERYASEASDGYRLFHIGSLEFATRDGELFHRSWNADRWRPTATEGLVIYGTPRIVEMNWGFVLVPSAGAGLWTSADGATWERVVGSDVVRVEEMASDGELFVGFVHLGAVGGPTSSVTTLDRDLRLDRFSLPYHVVGPVWEEGVGFAGTVAPPESGFVTSSDGFEWTLHDGSDLFEWVVAFDGELFFGSGESAVDGSPPAETPGAEGWLFSFGDTPAFQEASGTTWIHTGERWIDAAFGVEEGLPARPHVVIVRGSRVYAMVVGIDGVAETYLLELD